MAYGTDIITNLSPDHQYSFDGVLTDGVGTLDSTNVGCILTDTAICMDLTNCLTSNAVGDRVTLPVTGDIHTATAEKCVFGWFEVTAIQQPFCNIYGEGNSTVAFRMILGMGNNITFEIDDTSKIFQIFGDSALALNRPYHLYMDYSGTGNNSEVRAFIDGVEQSSALNDDTTVTTATLAARITPEFSDPSGTPAMGGETLLIVGGVNFKYNEWFLSNDAYTATQIRQDLFEYGALPDITISAGIESVMQTALDAYADTVRGDVPLCIRIEAVTGDGDLELTADNITFNALASIHVQYMGTGTLTWINDNAGDASIGSTPNGGTIVFVKPVTITINVKDLTDNSNVVGGMVRITAGAGGDLAEDTVIMAGTATNASGIATVAFSYISDQPIVGRVRKGTSTTYYIGGQIGGSITSDGFTTTILLIPDE